MADTDRIKRNLSKMIDQGAPEGDLDSYLKSEGFNSADAWKSALVPKPEARQPVAASAVYQGRPMSVAQPAPAQPKPEPAALPWSDLPGNIPHSAGAFANALVQPILHPVDTVTGVGNMLKGMEAPKEMVKATLPNGQTVHRPQDVAETPEQKAARVAPAEAAGDYFSDRFGSLRRIRNSLISDPVGMAADAATVATGGAALPGRAGLIAGKVASAVDPIAQTGNALKLAGKGGEVLASNALGMTTGAGTQSVRTAARAGREGGEKAEAFTQNMRGHVPVSDVVDTAKDAVGQMRVDRSKAYKEGMADLSKDKTVMDFAPIDNAVDKAANVGSFKGQTVEPRAQELVAEMRSTVNEWKALDPAEFHTPEGIDALKRRLGNLRDATQPGTPERVAADRVYKAVRDQLADQAPGYAKTMEAYQQASDKLNETTRTLSLTERASGDTAARKLVSATRTNVQTNFGGRQKLIDALAELEPTLPYQIAGQGMNTLAPRGLVARLAAMGTAPVNAFALPGFSPRLVGEGAYYAGKGAGLTEKAANALRITEENMRRAGRGSYQAGRLQEVQ